MCKDGGNKLVEIERLIEESGIGEMKQYKERFVGVMWIGCKIY